MAGHVAVVSGRRRGDTSTLNARASQISDALSQAGYEVSRLDAGDDLLTRLRELKPDVLFNGAAGPGFADGRLQGVCEHLRLRYTHSGVLASALASDRHQAKILYKSAGLPVTDHVLVNRAEAARDHVIAPPYVLKPRHMGTGAQHVLVKEAKDLPPQEVLSDSWAGGEDVLVERFLPGLTLVAVVMGDVALGLADVSEREALRSGEQMVESVRVPAGVSPNIYETARKLSLKAHAVLGCRSVTEIRFRYDPRSGPGIVPVLLDVNVQPNVASGSAAALLAERAGHSLEDLVRWIVEDASCDR